MGQYETPVEDGIVKREGPRPYCVRYRIGGKSRRKSFRTLTEARRFKIETRSAVHSGTFLDPKLRAVTFRDYVKHTYLPKMRFKWTENYARQTANTFERLMFPAFGDMALGAIEPEDVQAWIGDLADKGLKPSTIDTYYDRLRAVFTPAVSRGIIAQTPCRDIERPERDARSFKVLLPADVSRIAAAVEDRYELAVWLGAMSGLRIGEVLGLTVDRIDFERGVLHIDRQWKRLGTGFGFGATKTKRERDIPVSMDLIARIKAHIATYGVSSEGTLFSSVRGGTLDHSDFYRVWKPVKKLGLDPTQQKFHALRHHYASVLLDKTRDLNMVQARLGHTTITQTADTYGHLLPAADDRTRDAFEGLYAPVLRVA